MVSTSCYQIHGCAAFSPSVASPNLSGQNPSSPFETDSFSSPIPAHTISPRHKHRSNAARTRSTRRPWRSEWANPNLRTRRKTPPSLPLDLSSLVSTPESFPLFFVSILGFRNACLSADLDRPLPLCHAKDGRCMECGIVWGI